MLEIFLWDSGPCWCNCIMQILQIFQVYLHAAISQISRSWLGRTRQVTKLIVMFMKLVGDNFSVCGMVCYYRLRQSSKIDVCWKNFPRTVTPSPLSWTVDTKQDGSMYSFCWGQIQSLCLSRNYDLLDEMFSSLNFSNFDTAFWDAFLLIVPVQSGYLCYCSLSVN